MLIVLFLFLLSYSVYSQECETIADCNDNNYCTKDYCNGNCSHTNVSGCIKDNFKFLGDIFTIGKGPCKNDYEYDAVYRDENKITLLRGTESIPLIFGNISDYYGYPITYDFKILNKTVTFKFRYNQTQDFLYLQDIDKECPVTDSCSSTEECGDNNTCTIDECDGTPLACVHEVIAYCKDDDGCCPSKCNTTNDNDCISEQYQCNVSSDCDDNNSCTIDLCNETHKYCLNKAITGCIDADDCCPAGCVYNTDKDCEKPIICGDGTCEINETKENCCKDCGCKKDYECVENNCQKTKEAIAKETLEADSKFKEKKKELANKGFSLKESLFSKTAAGFDFKYVFKKGDKERSMTGLIDDQNNIVSIEVEGGIPTLWYIVIFVLIFLIIIVGLSVYRNIKLKKQQEKEAYYSRLLQQKFQRRPLKGPVYRRR